MAGIPTGICNAARLGPWLYSQIYEASPYQYQGNPCRIQHNHKDVNAILWYPGHGLSPSVLHDTQGIGMK